jgi:hypothetical protein
MVSDICDQQIPAFLMLPKKYATNHPMCADYASGKQWMVDFMELL